MWHLSLRSVGAWWCLLLLIALCDQPSLSDASQRRSRDPRHHHRHDVLPDFLPPPPPPPLAHRTASRTPFDPFGSFRFASARSQTKATAEGTESSAAPTGTADIVNSVYQILASKRDQNSADMTKVMQDKLATAKQADALREKAEELKERAAMLTRLQFCLEQDASKKKASVEGVSIECTSFSSGEDP